MKPTRLLPLLLVPFFSGCLCPDDVSFNHPVGITVTGDSDTRVWDGYIVVTFPPSDNVVDYTVHGYAQWSMPLRSMGDSNLRHRTPWEAKSSNAGLDRTVKLPLPLVYVHGEEGLVYAWQDRSESLEEYSHHSLRARRGLRSRTFPFDAAEDLPPR